VSSLSLHFVCFTWVDHRRRAFEISIATWGYHFSVKTRPLVDESRFLGKNQASMIVR
jgi:hypothetical protein